MKSGNEEVQHEKDWPDTEQSSGTTYVCGRDCGVYNCSYDGTLETYEKFANCDGDGEWNGDVEDYPDDGELLPLGDEPDVCALTRFWSPKSEDYQPLSSPRQKNVVANCEGDSQRTDPLAAAGVSTRVHVIDLQARRRVSSSACPDNGRDLSCGAKPNASVDEDSEVVLAAFALLRIRSTPNWDNVSVPDPDYEMLPQSRTAENSKTSSPLPTSGKKAARDVVPGRSKIVIRSTTESVTTELDQTCYPEKAESSNSEARFYYHGCWLPCILLSFTSAFTIMKVPLPSWFEGRR